MNKQELVRKIAADAEVTQWTASLVIDSAMEIIMNTVASGEKVQLSGFGNFVGHNRSYYTSKTSTATLNFNCAPSILNAWYLSSTTNNYYYPVTCNSVYQYDGMHNLFCADVFNGKTLKIAEATYAYVMNLVTGDQHLMNILGKDADNGATTTKAVISSQNGNTLHISAGALTDYRGKFSGNVNVSIDGNAYTTTFSGASDTTGTLVLTNGGCLTLASGADWIGEISLPTDSAGAETLTLNCGRIVVSNLVVAGVSKPIGVYGSSTSSAPAANQLGCLAGDGTEAHQGEGAHDGYAGAYVAVDHHDHGGDDHGQQDQAHQKAFSGVGAEGGRKGCESPADERYRQGNEVGVHHGICVQNGIKGE